MQRRSGIRDRIENQSANSQWLSLATGTYRQCLSAGVEGVAGWVVAAHKVGTSSTLQYLISKAWHQRARWTILKDGHEVGNDGNGQASPHRLLRLFSTLPVS